MIEKFDGYGSHLPVLRSLIKVIPPSRILEFGGGDHSTPFFTSVCKDVVTIETDSETWYKKCLNINPKALYIPDHDKVLEYAEKDERIYGIVFIDTAQALRWKLVNMCMTHTNMIIVVHDSEVMLNNYHLCRLPDGFVYMDFVQHRPWTGVFTCMPIVIQYMMNNHPGLLYDNELDLRNKAHLN